MADQKLIDATRAAGDVSLLDGRHGRKLGRPAGVRVRVALTATFGYLVTRRAIDARVTEPVRLTANAIGALNVELAVVGEGPVRHRLPERDHGTRSDDPGRVIRACRPTGSRVEDVAAYLPTRPGRGRQPGALDRRLEKRRSSGAGPEYFDESTPAVYSLPDDVRVGAVMWAAARLPDRTARFAGYGDETNVGLARPEPYEVMRLIGWRRPVATNEPSRRNRRRCGRSRRSLGMLEDAGIPATRDAGAFYPQPPACSSGCPRSSRRDARRPHLRDPGTRRLRRPAELRARVDRLYALADDCAAALAIDNYRPSSWRSRRATPSRCRRSSSP